MMPFKLAKGQINQKADWRAIDSPSKSTNKFVLFALLLFTANKIYGLPKLLSVLSDLYPLQGK